VLALTPSEYLSEAEIAAATIAEQGGVFNPQQQFPVTWPADPMVAQAYIDQLERSADLPETQVTELTGLLANVAERLEQGEGDAKLAAELQSMASRLSQSGGDAKAGKRRAALAETLNGIAARLN